MSTAKKITGIFLLLAFGAILFNACSRGFKKKIEVADKLKETITAKSVTVGYEKSTDAVNGKRNMTKLEFSGINPDGWDELGVNIASNLLAYRFIKSMSPQEISGETHVQVKMKMLDQKIYTNEFPISELKEAAPFIDIADKVVQACKAQDNQQLHNLNDQAYLPDSALGEIYYVNHYNDSIFAGINRKTELKGIRYANAEGDSNLEMFCALYLEEHPGVTTRYDVNIDRKTKKVVFIAVNTQPVKN